MGEKVQKFWRGILWPFRKVRAGWDRSPPPVRLYGGLIIFAFGFSWLLLVVYANMLPVLPDADPALLPGWWEPFGLLAAKGYLEPSAWKLGPENLRNLLWALSAYGVFLLALLGIYFSQARKIAADKTHALESKREQNERFAKAIEMLGTMDDDHRPTRLGAIYALGALAKESEDYFSTSVDTLAAFVRDRVNMDPAGEWPYWNRQDSTPAHGDYLSRLQDLRKKELGTRPIDEDISGALGVLSEINEHKNIWEARGIPVDLSVIDLRNALLENLDFSGFNLMGACLDFAYFRNTNFSDTNMAFVQMVGSYSTYCDFTNSQLLQSVAIGRRFENCSFIGAKLHGAILQASEFHSCDFESADCVEMEVEEACFLGPENLTAKQVSEMTDWETATFPKELLPKDDD